MKHIELSTLTVMHAAPGPYLPHITHGARRVDG
jgi:hypothetical protein